MNGQQQTPEENTDNQIVKPITQNTTVKQKPQFTKWFWGTIIALFVVTLIMILLSMLNTSDKHLSSIKDEILLPPEIIKTIKVKATQGLANLDSKSYSPSFQNTVEQSIDKAFEPVYKNIPSFADKYYSIVGQYAALALKASESVSGNDKLAEYIQKILMPNLEKNLKKSSRKISDKFTQEIISLAKTNINLPSGNQPALTSFLTQELERQLSHFKAASYVGTGFLGSIASIKLIASTIARKIILKVGVKFAVKTGGKLAGIATGVSAGALCGPAAPFCAVAGATIGWFAADAAFTSIDEVINRDEFEQEIKQAIDEYKKRVKQKTFDQLDAMKQKIAILAKEQIQGKTPSEL